MIRANVEEDHEATMASFLNGLNHEISIIVELQHYVEMENLLHREIKVERRMQRKGSRSNINFRQSSSSWKSNCRKEDVSISKPNVETIKKKEDVVVVNKGRLETQQRNQDIKCFKCHGLGHISTHYPNKRTMVMRGGEIVINSEEEEEEPMPSLDDKSDVDLEFPVEGKVLVTRCVLSALVKEDDIEHQRENIFHTRYHVNNKVCSLIIDGGSCTNVTSALFVEKLQLQSLKYPRPYKLQWLNDSEKARVQKQVLISFSIGKHHDEILCDVVSMYASHILLGKPRQFDRRANHDSFKNCFSFMKDNKLVTLISLTPKQVYEDQVKLKQGCD